MTSSSAALLDRVIEDLFARHTTDVAVAQAARRDYEERRGKVHQDDPLWEPWSSAFVEWFVVERVPAGDTVPPAARTYQAMDRADPDAKIIRALVTSHRSLFEVRAIAPGRIELLDLFGGAQFDVVEQRQLHGVDVGDVAELRLIGTDEVRFGRTFIYHPKSARGAIVDRARHMLAKGSSRRDVIDQVAHLRIQVTRYRHMAPAKVYELGSRIGT